MFDTFLLNSPVESHRIKALEKIRGRSGPKLADAVIPRLTDTSRAVRLLACELLAESKEENVIAALRAVVVNDTFEVAQVAIRTLGRLGEPGAGALRDVIRTVDLPDFGRRVAAIRAIAGLPSSVPILIEVLSDKQRDVITASMNALIGLGSVAINACVSAITGQNWVRRHNAAVVLSTLKWMPSNDSEKAEFLAASGQIDAAIALGSLATDALAQALDNPANRIAAALGLVRLGDGRGETVLESSLASSLDHLRDLFKEHQLQMDNNAISSGTRQLLSVLNATPRTRAKAPQVLEELFVHVERIPVTDERRGMKRALVSTLLTLDSSARPLLRKTLLHSNTDLAHEQATLIIKRLAEFHDVEGLVEYCQREFADKFPPTNHPKDPRSREALEILWSLDPASAKRVLLPALSKLDRLLGYGKDREADTLLDFVPRCSDVETVNAIVGAISRIDEGNSRFRFLSRVHTTLRGLGSDSAVVPLVKTCLQGCGSGIRDAGVLLSEVVRQHPEQAAQPYAQFILGLVKTYRNECYYETVSCLLQVAAANPSLIPDDVLSAMADTEPVFQEVIWSEDHGERVDYGGRKSVRLRDTSSSVRDTVERVRSLARSEIARRR